MNQNLSITTSSGGMEMVKQQECLITFENSPLVLYHHHDNNNCKLSSINPKEQKENTKSQWEEFIIHLSRWNVFRKHLPSLIILSLIHYMLLGGPLDTIHCTEHARLVPIGLCWLYCFYSLLSSIISESIVGMKGKGIQLEKTTFLGLKSHQVFIPLENIKYVAITEGFHIDSVIYYLAIILKQPYKNKMVIVPFEMFNPRLNLLRKVYPKLKRVLFE